MIGVVITAHNQGRLLEECLDSIYKQGVTCEIIVIDDASDPPVECRHPAHAVQWKVIRLWDNMGVQRARNIGWWELKDSCPYIIFCDGDVQWKPGAFRLMQKAMEVRRQTDHRVAIAYGDYDRVGAITGLWRAKKFSVEELRRQNYISTMALVATKALPNPPFVEDEDRLQDWSLWLRMVNDGYTGVHVAATLFTAFYEDNSVSTRDIRDYEKWHNLLMERYVKNGRKH